jgi:hypothetical protein
MLLKRESYPCHPERIRRDGGATKESKDRDAAVITMLPQNSFMSVVPGSFLPSHEKIFLLRADCVFFWRHCLA